jgi:hypothetical protein
VLITTIYGCSKLTTGKTRGGKVIKTFNKWYDALQEPWRFLLAMTLIMSGITGLSFGPYPVKIIAAIYLMILVLIRMKGRFNATT